MATKKKSAKVKSKHPMAWGGEAAKAASKSVKHGGATVHDAERRYASAKREYHEVGDALMKAHKN